MGGMLYTSASGQESIPLSLSKLYCSAFKPEGRPANSVLLEFVPDRPRDQLYQFGKSFGLWNSLVATETDFADPPDTILTEPPKQSRCH